MHRLIALGFILSLSGCATSFRPKETPSPALSPFAFTLTPEQCERLRAERRNYRAVERTSSYVSGAGALVTTTLLAIPALRDEQAVQGAAAGVGLLAGGVMVFSGTQVDDLAKEIEDGGCR
jgi:hypothetical protein